MKTTPTPLQQCLAAQTALVQKAKAQAEQLRQALNDPHPPPLVRYIRAAALGNSLQAMAEGLQHSPTQDAHSAAELRSILAEVQEILEYVREVREAHCPPQLTHTPLKPPAAAAPHEEGR